MYLETEPPGLVTDSVVVRESFNRTDRGNSWTAIEEVLGANLLELVSVDSLQEFLER